MVAAMFAGTPISFLTMVVPLSSDSAPYSLALTSLLAAGMLAVVALTSPTRQLATAAAHVGAASCVTLVAVTAMSDVKIYQLLYFIGAVLTGTATGVVYLALHRSKPKLSPVNQWPPPPNSPQLQ